ncbi:unnamed protein product [Caenorhabditis angaria]|uniref:Cell cycle control protein 50A n=1 Tax=Caenorhabditis angaria TaxID=860376 RepID=A0A9P1ILY6_9PELO|nr:unnamed protein product [Caenorhabditis angaria]
MPPQAQPATTTSISSPESEKILKNRPKASALRQQKLPAWQPILTASTVIPTVIAIGLIFIPIGIALFLASDSVFELEVDYTDCGSPCTRQIEIKEDVKGDVYLYYYLENYYQNHRRYVKSRTDQQYYGDILNVKDCAPFDVDPATKKPYAPCGAIANSIFNDTFSLTYSDTLPVLVPVTTEGVIWDVDKDKKFKNPTIPAGQTLCSVFSGTVKPPNWQVDPCTNGGFENVDFIIWMRTAALPNFRKLWRIVNKEKVGNADFTNGLPKGTYSLTVINNYPVKSFGGRKKFIISTTSWAGGKNSFLGIAYLVVGSLAILLGVVFIIIHVKFGHSMSELSNVNGMDH